MGPAKILLQVVLAQSYLDVMHASASCTSSAPAVLFVQSQSCILKPECQLVAHHLPLLCPSFNLSHAFCSLRSTPSCPSHDACVKYTILIDWIAQSNYLHYHAIEASLHLP